MTTYLESPTTICLFTIQLFWAQVKNKGPLLPRPLLLKAKLSENFVKVPTEMGHILTVFFGVRSPQFEKVAIFNAKGMSLCESTSSKPFCIKIGSGGLIPQRWARKKWSHTEAHRNEMSPLIQSCTTVRLANCDYDDTSFWISADANKDDLVRP